MICFFSLFFSLILLYLFENKSLIFFQENNKNSNNNSNKKKVEKEVTYSVRFGFHLRGSFYELIRLKMNKNEKKRI